MAIIGKIRDNSVLVITVVGLSLALFIVGDWIPGLGGRESDYGIGEAFGEPIDPQVYDSMLDTRMKNAEMYFANMGQEFTDQTRDQVREETWNALIEDIIYAHELKNFPFLVNSDELNDMVHGVDIFPQLADAEIFKDITGNFSRDSVAKYLNRLEQDTAAKRAWKEFEGTMRKERIREKYKTLVSQSLYITNSEAQKDYTAAVKKYSVRFVMKPYYEIPDTSVQVTDAEIRAFYEKNKKRKQFENFGSRIYNYVVFDVAPGEKDKKAAKEELEFLKEEFRKSENDSAFIMSYSESKLYNPDRFSDQMDGFSYEMDNAVQNANPGDVIGPFLQRGSYKLLKIIETKDTTGEQCWARHILLGTDDGSTTETRRMKAEQIIAEIKEKNNFVEMSDKYSIDKVSAANGGSLDWFGKGRMVAPFEEVCFAAKTGELVIAETQFGTHIVEIMGKRDKFKVARYHMVDKKIKPLAETEEAVRNKANEFRDAIPDGTKFEETAQKFNLNVLEDELYDAQREISSVPGSRSLAIWMLNASESDVSDAEVCGDKIVIATVTNIKEKGIPDFEDVKEAMEVPTRQEKKGDMLVKQMSNISSLEELAVKTGTTIRDSVDITFASLSVPKGGGNEPDVVGTVTSLSKEQKGSITVPIKGRMGVYVVQLVDVYETPTGQPYSENKKAMTLTRRSTAASKAFEALKKKANVVDKRAVN